MQLATKYKGVTSALATVDIQAGKYSNSEYYTGPLKCLHLHVDTNECLTNKGVATTTAMTQMKVTVVPAIMPGRRKQSADGQAQRSVAKSSKLNSRAKRAANFGPSYF